MFSSSKLRHVAATLCLLALGLLAALPTEHLHAADSSIHGIVIHRHLAHGTTSPLAAPADHDEHEADHHDDEATAHYDEDAPASHGDHAAARSLSPVFQSSQKFTPTVPAVVTAHPVFLPDPPLLSHVVTRDDVAVHRPPLRLLPARAPPAHA